MPSTHPSSQLPYRLDEVQPLLLPPLLYHNDAQHSHSFFLTTMESPVFGEQTFFGAFPSDDAGRINFYVGARSVLLIALFHFHFPCGGVNMSACKEKAVDALGEYDGRVMERN